jgi:preprotein translocase subunit SecG
MKKIAIFVVVIFLATTMAYAWPWSKKGSEEVTGKGKETKQKMTEKKSVKKADKKATKSTTKTTKKSMKKAPAKK